MLLLRCSYCATPPTALLLLRCSYCAAPAAMLLLRCSSYCAAPTALLLLRYSYCAAPTALAALLVASLYLFIKVYNLMPAPLCIRRCICIAHMDTCTPWSGSLAPAFLHACMLYLLGCGMYSSRLACIAVAPSLLLQRFASIGWL
jgi:hypothetical protein